MKTLKSFIVLSTIALSTLFLQSCSSDDDNNDGISNPPALRGQANIKFEHVWGPAEQPFSLHAAYTHPASGEEITITELRYYITNIRLHANDGSTWVEPESYHLVDASDSEFHLQLNEVPSKEYTSMTYLLGVDSLRNSSGAQTGALDPVHNMFWSWNTGYIFVRAEGTSPASPDGHFTYHLGGFSGPYNAIREIHHSFDETILRVAPDANPSVHVMVQAARFWHGGISLADISGVHMPGANAALLATNFAGGFRYDHIHN